MLLNLEEVSSLSLYKIIYNKLKRFEIANLYNIRIRGERDRLCIKCHDAQSLKWHRRYALLFISSSAKFQSHTGQQMTNFDQNLILSRLKLQFELTDAHNMIHKAWSGIEEVFYLFEAICQVLP